MPERRTGHIQAPELLEKAQQLERQQKLGGAAEAYDAALAIDPNSRVAAEGRARVAIERREEQAALHCARALAFHDSNPELQQRMLATATSRIGLSAIPLLEAHIARNPGSVSVHELLADLRAQDDGGDSFKDSYRAALESRPHDKALLMSYWNVLTRAGQLTEALESMDSHEERLGDDRDFLLLKLNIANHAGQSQRARRLVARLDDRPDAALAKGQHHLQEGRPTEAAALLEHVVQEEAGNLSAWALLEVAWRLTGDRRHEWLVQPGLISESKVDLAAPQLDAIAAMLRSTHETRAQPLGQSVRGGTQTLGQLFLRPEPEIETLKRALADAIRTFVSGLPPRDPAHPLLAHRDDGIAFGPSWSVRLSGGGYHAAHFHPGGIVSSACYIKLPGELPGSAAQAGWLEIGRTPPELGVDLPPLATFEPKEGYLVLFPSFLFHGTRPFDAGERLTVAFDLVPVPRY